MQPIEKVWRTFRIEMELAATYPKAQATRTGTFSIPFHWLDDLMTTLLFIRAMEIHDDALQEEIQSRGETVPRKYHRSLKGRLDCSDHWSDFPGPVLKAHADRRNELAHEAAQRASWQELRACVSDLESNLVALGCLNTAVSVGTEYERIKGPTSQPGVHDLIWHVKIIVNGAVHQVWNLTERYEIKPADCNNSET